MVRVVRAASESRNIMWKYFRFLVRKEEGVPPAQAQPTIRLNRAYSYLLEKATHHFYYILRQLHTLHYSQHNHLRHYHQHNHHNWHNFHNPKHQGHSRVSIIIHHYQDSRIKYQHSNLERD